MREANEFLAAGNPLLIAIDHAAGKQMSVPVCEGWIFQMATGAVRLAVRHQAELVPCAVIDGGRWRFRIKIGNPVPAEFLAGGVDCIHAGKHLLNELLPVFQEHPGQCSNQLIKCFQPTPQISPAKNPTDESLLLCNLLRDNPVVVTGMGCVSAAGDTVAALWEAAVAGRSTAEWREFEMGTGCSRFAVCSAPEPDVSRPELRPARKMDRSAQMALLAASQAWKQARLSGAYSPAQIGMAVGSSRGPLGKVCESFASLGRPNYPPSLSANCAFGSLGGMLAQAFKLNGPGATISATCASSAFAIGFAAEQILLGKAEVMLAGGAEAPLQPVVLAQLGSAGVLGFHEEARRTCRPFDATRTEWSWAKAAHFWSSIGPRC